MSLVRRNRRGQVIWRHQDTFLPAVGRYRCRGCEKPSVKPWRFYCSSACRKAFNETVPEWWSETRWRILQRDCHRCVLCGAGESAGLRSRLEVDHIKPVALYPELEFQDSNLRTLCRECHKTHGAKPQSPRWRRGNMPGQRRLDAPLEAT